MPIKKLFHSHHRVRTAWWVLFALWVCAIFVLSALSGPQIELWMWDILNWDKFCHAVAFAAGAVILSFAVRWSSSLPKRVVVPLVIVVISLFGATDEWHQTFTPERSGGDVFDWLADTVGATLGAFLSYARASRFGKSTRESGATASRD